MYDRGVMSLGSTVKGWSHAWAFQDYLSMVRVLDGKSNRITYMTEISDGKQQSNWKCHDDDCVYTVGWGQFSYSAMKRSVKISKCLLKIQLFGRSGMLEYYRRYSYKRHS